MATVLAVAEVAAAVAAAAAVEIAAVGFDASHHQPMTGQHRQRQALHHLELECPELGLQRRPD